MSKNRKLCIDPYTDEQLIQALLEQDFSNENVLWTGTNGVMYLAALRLQQLIDQQLKLIDQQPTKSGD